MDDLKKLIQDTCHQLFNLEIEPELSRPDEKFGDYATNIALQLANQPNTTTTNPREIADQIVANLKTDNILSLEVAGPGFINIRLTDQALLNNISRSNQKTLAGKVVVAEYSDPNPFKILHAGHLYTTLVGNTVANLLEVAGADVKRVNFGGDVGLHVARAMWAISRKIGDSDAESFLNNLPANSRPEWISQCYVEGNTAYENDETAKNEIIALNKRIYELHTNGDKTSNFAKTYWICRQWSYDGFEELYRNLGVKPFDKYYPESSTTQLGIDSVNKLLEQGVLEKSDGAVVYRGEKDGLHTRVFINSNGLPTYEAKDLGLAITKWQDYHFDKSIMITANEISEYMKVVLKVVEALDPEIAKRSTHLTHGMILMVGGQKMSSRTGKALLAQDVLAAAAEANLKATGKIDNSVVIGAVKYAFLKNRIGGDLIYDPVESVSLEGNSGPYLQYAHARARSILRKKAPKDNLPDGLDPGERSLVLKITEYSEVVDKAVQDLMPHHICSYLYELAQIFNRFYENNRVIDDAREEQRLQLVRSYADTLKNGLELLGISAPEQM